MSAGTLTLTNGSAVVKGAGTTLTTELVAGDFIAVTVGGIPYTLPVVSVDGDTQLTLVTKFTGPTQAGAGWYAVPRIAMNLVYAASVIQMTEVMRGFSNDKTNWLSFFTADGDAIIKMPDGNQFTGPSAKKLISMMAGKADLLNGAVPVEQGGTGASDAAQALTNLGGVSTSDNRLETIANKKGGSVVGGIGVKNNARAPAFVSESSNMWEEASGSYRNLLAQAIVDSNRYGIIDYYASNSAGRAYIRFIPYASPTSFFVATADHTGEMTARVFTPTSDERVKYQIEEIADPEEKLNMLRGVTFRYLSGDLFGIGYIGQDVERAFPEAVSKSPDPVVLPDGKIIDKVIRPDTYGVGVAVLTEMCKKLARQRDEAIKRADNQEAFLKTLGFDPQKDYTA
ncbi:tail fiber domain-containing protein [Franconibacter helveticus]|uniref:tail fiber domain-containing protein n=1 Tax=Franconibacter helveticus TaxID=357240 RepID=UPI000DA1EEBF|nr:tail fiber domain-containing protein [Franconibacter helveticus]